MVSIHDAAQAARDAGLSLIPIKSDGTKAPPFEWAAYQVNPPSREQISAWFETGRYTGLGLVGGKVSRNLVCWDFDDGDVYQTFLDTTEAAGYGPLTGRSRARSLLVVRDLIRQSQTSMPRR